MYCACAYSIFMGKLNKKDGMDLFKIKIRFLWTC